MQRSLAAARVKVAVDVSNFVADFGKRFFCWGAPNFAGKYEPTACLRAAVQGLLDNSGLRKSKEREEVIKMIRTDSKFKNNVGRGIANIVTGGSSSIPVEEGIIDAVKHGIKMIAHAVSKATLLHVYGYSGERGGILRWKSTAKGFGSFVCDSLNVMDSVTLRTAELHLIDPTVQAAPCRAPLP